MKQERLRKVKRIRLIHWNPEEGGERADSLRQSCFQVEFEPFDRMTLKRAGEDPPDVIVIDLSRMPSQGRDVGIAMRRRKTTRHIPLVFAGGSPEKTEGIIKILPDAIYASWNDIRESIERAAGKKPADPVVPASQFAAYAGRQLPAKLGISEGTSVTLIRPPEGFIRTLGRLPKGSRIRKSGSGKSDIVILFVRSTDDLEKRLERAKGLMADGGSLWIAWQKKVSGAGSDLTQAKVRRKGLDLGLVDYRICSMDEEWSGLRFARRDN